MWKSSRPGLGSRQECGSHRQPQAPSVCSPRGRRRPAFLGRTGGLGGGDRGVLSLESVPSEFWGPGPWEGADSPPQGHQASLASPQGSRTWQHCGVSKQLWFLGVPRAQLPRPREPAARELGGQSRSAEPHPHLTSPWGSSGTWMGKGQQGWAPTATWSRHRPCAWRPSEPAWPSNGFAPYSLDILWLLPASAGGCPIPLPSAPAPWAHTRSQSRKGSPVVSPAL